MGRGRPVNVDVNGRPISNIVGGVDDEVAEQMMGSLTSGLSHGRTQGGSLAQMPSAGGQVNLDDIDVSQFLEVVPTSGMSRQFTVGAPVTPGINSAGAAAMDAGADTFASGASRMPNKKIGDFWVLDETAASQLPDDFAIKGTKGHMTRKYGKDAAKSWTALNNAKQTLSALTGVGLSVGVGYAVISSAVESEKKREACKNRCKAELPPPNMRKYDPVTDDLGNESALICAHFHQDPLPFYQSLEADLPQNPPSSNENWSTFDWLKYWLGYTQETAPSQDGQTQKRPCETEQENNFDKECLRSRLENCCDDYCDREYDMLNYMAHRFGEGMGGAAGSFCEGLLGTNCRPPDFEMGGILRPIMILVGVMIALVVGIEVFKAMNSSSPKVYVQSQQRPRRPAGDGRSYRGACDAPRVFR